MEFKYAILLACLAFGIFLVYKEFKRKNKAHLVWRIIASVAMVGAFAALIVPITYTVKKVESVNELNLITVGTSSPTIAAIKGNKYYVDSAVLKAHQNIKANYLPDLAYHLQLHPELKQVHIYGYGLGKEELKKLENHTVAFHAGSVPSGVISCNWPAELKATTPLIVQGNYQNESDQAIKLLLFGLGKNIDSLSVKAKSSVDFSFKTIPKQTGKAVYRLIALQGKDTLSKEPVPFTVAKKEVMNVLVLASFPDFEYKFLKKWLYENQYPVALRSRISKNKYSTDFLNRKETNLDQINSETLKNIAVLLADEEELKALSAKERSTIQLAVENGMGLMIRLIDPKQTNPFQNFNRYEIPASAEKPLAFKIPAENANLNVLPFVQTLFLKTGANEQILVADTKGRAVVSTQLHGMGQVMGSTISATYQWQLAGKSADYTTFWSTLLDKASRKKSMDQTVQFVPQLTTVDQRTRLIVSGTDDKVPDMRLGEVKLSPRQNMELPFEWDAVFWPSQLGWNQLKINQKAVDFYVYQKSDWQNLKNANKISSTNHFIANQNKKQVNALQNNSSVEKEISKWWFLAIFLMAASFLWYELRILENK
ncbi:hypothetical protein [Pedobacter sp. Hv1]|uniref:hypothetical protein n=1 Tax=Pedobacter sp. Hv1 TaxID=1740090 RepID=UPI0006D8C8C7|nr:hypothetical protein [Pedobacter sp. Hv1]KQC01276.1 hypothetical protein AQF98_11525 [Pedobacter sp. Hv1]